MNNIIIKIPTPQQVSDCFDLVAMADENGLLDITNELDLSAAKKTCRRFFGDNGYYFSSSNILVAVAESTVVGCVLCFSGKDERDFKPYPKRIGLDTTMEAELDELYIDSLAVYPQYRKRGIATQLIRAVVDAAQRRDLKKVSLFADASDESLHKFYLSLGFRVERAASLHGEDFLKLVCDVE